MVYSDYELGSSTRIDTLRSQRRAETRRKYESFGGPMFLITSFSALLGSGFYFWRKFHQYNTGVRLAGTVFLSFSIMKMINSLAVVNFGDVSEVIYLNKAKSLEGVRDVHKTDLELKDKEWKDFQEETINKLNKKK
jgi:hypothetical protein